ncbi:Aureobasidin A1 biosynthesis complex [Rhodococcus sp. 06-156-3C]|uniref:condensation domain-containing protein n=1 Tax=Nocardiaceae TaxID=85025 RepID=UPI000522EC6D|nr:MULTISPECIES: condensation domain-containing protein [Rhodococcus]OZD19406.1 Aureobasidin A1 biosynthesis complex [Rhodococcus sp. 06-156-3C]OZD21739.1 Aureobasidin A1 biosynthesis complex [Rhodococcus sp. 06-156-4C]OZD25426.1 Aureobasidin A1 biosynthesis complex [Rhodococcus sp. 06-156-4a]OZD32961.1 Aureobasidin A1 biosynthesis complex [Rhodococcus sp. 06-156-3b]OZD41965.1 Aureobasidin A1 biosynthesis complex [Rhodococcus sp. 06-156-3]
MEYTELADYPLPAGKLTEWVPAVASEAWREDPRGISFTHEDHCSRGNDGSWIGTVFEIHRRYDVEVMRRTIGAYIARHEAFRTRVERDDRTGAWRRYTVDADAVTVDDRAESSSWSESQVFEHLESWFADVVSPTTWPHFVLATVVPEPHVAASVPQQDKFLVAFAADHSVMDAYSQIYAINEFDRLYAHVLDGAEHGLPEVGSYVDFSAAERALGESLTADHDAVLAWDRFLAAEDGRFPAFPLPLRAENSSAPTDLATRQSSVSSWLLTTEQVEAFNAKCRAAGQNMQAGILAALALVNSRLTGNGTFRTIMPMHTRYAEKWAASVGWYVGILPMEIRLDDATTFAEAIDRANIGATEYKRLAAMPYSKIASLMSSTEIPRFVVSYIDLRFLPDGEEWQERKGRALRSECHAEDEVYFWINRTLQGLNISARFPSSDVSTTNVHRFITEFVSVVTAVIEEPTETLDSAVAAVGAGRE